MSNDVYPLGEDTSDVDEPVEKINVGAALEKLTEKQVPIAHPIYRAKCVWPWEKHEKLKLRGVGENCI